MFAPHCADEVAPRPPASPKQQKFSRFHHTISLGQSVILFPACSLLPAPCSLLLPPPPPLPPPLPPLLLLVLLLLLQVEARVRSMRAELERELSAGTTTPRAATSK